MLKSVQHLQARLERQEQLIAELRLDKQLNELVVAGLAAILAKDTSTEALQEFILLINQVIQNDLCLLFSESDEDLLLLVDSAIERSSLTFIQSRRRFPLLPFVTLSNVDDLSLCPTWKAHYAARWSGAVSALVQPIRTKHNRYFLIVASHVPSHFNDRDVGLLSTFSSIVGSTISHIESRNIREIYRRGVQQTEKMAALSQLAAGVAHEINNPLSVVCSNFRSLKDYVSNIGQYVEAVNEALLSESLSACQEKISNLKRIHRIDQVLPDLFPLMQDAEAGLARIVDTVSGLKTFAHLDSGRRVKIDLREVITTVQKMLLGELKYKASLTYHLGADPVQILGNAPKLHQVFVNLITNAIQSIDHDHGEVEVIVERRGSMSVAIVVDNGSGISKQHLDRIFDPFFTTKAIGRGVGMGLPVVKAIIEEHRGELKVDSKLGQGTRMYITFPAISDDAPIIGLDNVSGESR